MRPTADVENVSGAILVEIFRVMGLRDSAWGRQVVGRIFRPAARRLAGMVVPLDQDIAQRGLSAAVSDFLPGFVDNVRLMGVEQIPKAGPLLVVSNHPAAYDVLILVVGLGRDDLKVISSEISILAHLPAIASHFISISDDSHRRMVAVRLALRHLLEGGALLVFPRGNVEPDPAVSPGASESLEDWSPSLELFLRKEPRTKSIVTIVSGVLSARWFQNPIIRMWRKPEQRQKVAEIFQVTQQLILSKRPPLSPLVTFSRSLTLADLGGIEVPVGGLLKAIIEEARFLLDEHESHYGAKTVNPS